jgi:preprotein translocase subunit SecE
MSQDKTPVEESPAKEFMEVSANPVERARRYMQDVRREIKHVVWPTWNQVRSTTFVVLFFTFAMTVFIGVIDWIALFLYRLVVKR